MARRRPRQRVMIEGMPSAGTPCAKLKRLFIQAEIEAHTGMVTGDEDRHTFGEEQSELLFKQGYKQGCPWARK